VWRRKGRKGRRKLRGKVVGGEESKEKKGREKEENRRKKWGEKGKWSKRGKLIVGQNGRGR
jgi:hypothetical protein